MPVFQGCRATRILVEPESLQLTTWTANRRSQVVSHAAVEMAGMSERIDRAVLNIPPAVLGIVPASVAYRENDLPLGWDGETLAVAMENPSDADALGDA